MSYTHEISVDGKIITITVTNDNYWVSEWIRKVWSARFPTVIGLDIEWTPAFVLGSSKKTATLHLCIDRKCLIVPLLHKDSVPESLKSFLKNSCYMFVGVEIAGDVHKLRDEYGVVCAKHVDLRELAEEKWPGRFRKLVLQYLAREVAGLDIRKPTNAGMNHEASELKPSSVSVTSTASEVNLEQIASACIDAYATYKLGTHLV